MRVTPSPQPGRVPTVYRPLAQILSRQQAEPGVDLGARETDRETNRGTESPDLSKAQSKPYPACTVSVPSGSPQPQRVSRPSVCPPGSLGVSGDGSPPPPSIPHL